MALFVTRNTVYYRQILERLSEEGHHVDEEDLSHLWSTRYEHINPYGKYSFDLTNNDGIGGESLRPLCAG